MARRGPDGRRLRQESRQAETGSSGSRSAAIDRSRAKARRASPGFVLYVEGARDRELLACWARRIDSELVRCIEQSTVILGGRQPARAELDFRKRGGIAAGLSGLIVLDRDHHDELPAEPIEAGLDLFVWSLRHIESYLLVPVAIRRLLRLDDEDRAIERLIEDRAPRTDDVKRILGAGGWLSAALGVELRASAIARAMRPEELHDDVHALFREIRRRAGFGAERPDVVIRRGGNPSEP